MTQPRANICTALFVVLWSSVAWADQRVGGGGEALTFFLEHTRQKMVNLLSNLSERPDKYELMEEMCVEADDSLDDDQKETCARFVVDSAAAIIKLNHAPTKVAFKTSPEPLFVEEFDEKKMVAATPGDMPTDPITFSYPATNHMDREKLMLVMFHEFGHKVRFDGYFPLDTIPVGKLMGRRFLDITAGAFVAFAKKIRFLGENPTIRDRFKCEVTTRGWATVLQIEEEEDRLFTGEGNQLLSSYQTGFFNLETGAGNFQITPGGTRVRLRLTINEGADCKTTADFEKRRIVFSLISVDEYGRPLSVVDANGTPSLLPPLETSPQYQGNPLCMKGKAFTYSFAAGLTYSCWYTNLPRPEDQESPE